MRDEEKLKTQPFHKLEVKDNSASPFRDADGKMSGIPAAITDVRDLKRVQEALKDSEARYKALMDLAPDGILVHDGERILYCNQVAVLLHGAEHANQLIGISPVDMVHSDEKETLRTRVRGVLAGRIAPRLEYRYRRRDGQELAVEASAAPIIWQGKPAVQVVLRDMTGHKISEAALAETHERALWLARFPEENPNPVVRASHEGKVLYRNPSAAQLEGWSEAVGHPMGDSLISLVQQSMKDNREHQRDIELAGRIYSVSAVPFVDDRYVNIYGIDTTEQKRAEKALYESQLDLNRAQAVGRIGSWRLNVSRNELLWSDENHRIFGIAKGTPLTYETFLGTAHPEDRAYVHERWMAALRGEPYDIEHRIVLTDSVKWVRERAELEFDANGELLGGFGTTQDISDRKRAEEALRDSEAAAKLLSETASRLLETENPRIIVEDLCRKVMRHLCCDVFFNFLLDEQAGRLHLNACAGISEVERNSIEWLDYGVAVRGCIARGKERIVANEILYIPAPRMEPVKSHGIQAYACHPLMTRDQLIGTLSFGSKTRSRFTSQEIDLMKTVSDQVAVAMERKKLMDMLQRSRDELEVRVRVRTDELEKANTDKMTIQAEAMQASHLVSLGELAASVAHEINNPINGIINYAQILANNAVAESRELDISNRIIKEGDRIANIVRSLLSFARDDQKGKGPCSFREILGDTLTLVHAPMRKEGIHLILEMAENLPLVFVNTQHIQQVLLNVINNARYALNRKYPEPDDDKEIKIGGLCIRREGRNFLRVTFLDRGIGIGADILGSVMEPFFSTKPIKHGTGLGLPISNRIIKDHGGRLEIESVVGEYTNVIVELPAWEEG
ncbi:MAG: PAS domain S-box protein [Pseudomonadota bacterium]